MKSFAKWTDMVFLFLISVGMLTLPLCDLWFAKSRDFEYKTYVLCSGFVLLLFAMIQTKIHRTWGKWTLAVFSTAFITIGVFLYNNLLHYLFLKPIFFGTDYSYLNELKHDINYTGGLGVFRYVLYAAAIMVICSAIIIVHKLIITGKISKCIWRMRMRVLMHRVKREGKVPASYVVLDAPSGYGKTFYSRKICELIPANEVKVMSSEEFMDSFHSFIRQGNYYSGCYPMEEVFKDIKVIVIEDIDIFLAGREATQEEVAHILLGAIENGVSVVVTGIDIATKAPYFFWKMDCINYRTERYIFAK